MDNFEFAKKDVIEIAKALVEYAVNFEVGDNQGFQVGGYVCTYCYGDKVGWIKQFKHEKICPVLVANTLLAQIPGKTNE